MTPIAVSINTSRRGRSVIAFTPAQRLEVCRRIQLVGMRYSLLVCCLVDDHLHIVALCSLDEAGALAQAVESSITQVLGLKPGFGRYWVKPITDQKHLETSIRYVLDQARRHQSRSDLDHHGNNGPELLGGRLLRTKRGGLVLPPCREVLRAHAPKVDLDKLEKLLFGDAPRVALKNMPAAPGGLAGRDLEAVCREAAAVAIGLPEFPPRGGGVSDALAALLLLVESSGFAESVDAQRMLGVCGGSVRRLRKRTVPVPLGAAVRWQLEFRLSRREFGLRR